MLDSQIETYAEIARQVIGDLKIAPDAEPAPWFTKDIYRAKDLQWTGWIGGFGSETYALGFALNLEFTPAWRRVHRKIAGDFQQFSDLLRRHPDYAWHWHGRPRMRVRNPKVRIYAELPSLIQVDLTQWLNELEDILEDRRMWSPGIAIRPQLGIARQVGLPSQLSDSALIRHNIQQVVDELNPLVTFLKSARPYSVRSVLN